MLRIVFMGTPDLAAVSLRALLANAEFQVAAVVTQPDRPKGRHLKLQFSPVKEVAVEHGLPVLQPQRAREAELIMRLSEIVSDLIVVAAFGQILPQSILDLPKHGCLNVHTSLLPRYRGAAPIQWAIMNGETETGVTIMKMDAGMDTGPILTQAATPIGPTEDAQALHDRLAALGASLLLKTIPDYVSGKIQPSPQPTEGVSHAPKIKKTDGLIDWAQSAVSIFNRVRGLAPWPGAYTYLPTQPHGEGLFVQLVGNSPDPELLKIWKAEPTDDAGSPGAILRADKSELVVACGRGALRILELQRQGGKRLTVHDFQAGHKLMVRSIMGGAH